MNLLKKRRSLLCCENTKIFMFSVYTAFLKEEKVFLILRTEKLEICENVFDYQ